MSAWIGIDLDGTLAYWGDGYNTDVLKIGDPIPAMVDRMKRMLAEGKDVRIFTARVGDATDAECSDAMDVPCTFTEWRDYQRRLIQDWCSEHLGQVLPVTATKDFHMIQLYDDRCVQMEPNTGLTVFEVALAKHMAGEGA